MTSNGIFSVDGQSVIITGGGMGIGKIYSHTCARAGLCTPPLTTLSGCTAGCV